MTYVPRSYPEIVRDLLTTLTGGVVREELTVPPDDDPTLAPARLAERPVRRISYLEGQTTVGSGADARTIPYRFTAADFELVSANGDGAPDAIAFREGGRRPVPLSTLTVNYYPVETAPAPLTDLNIGSVTRTLMETFARELALAYLHLRHVYDSAFLDTAEGGSLDKVVALVGVGRLAAGHPVATVRLGRRPGTPGRITVPAGTPLVDAAGSRYLTVADLSLEPGEASRTVLARGESPATPLVEAGALDRPEVVLAGISEVTNPEPARALAAAESDQELRRRAAGALHGVARGTLDALRFGLLSIDGVRDVTVLEFPNGVPGELRVTVAYAQDTPAVRAEVDRVLREMRPAGVRVEGVTATPKRVVVQVALTVAGAQPPSAAETADLQAALAERIAGYLRGLTPGGRARRTRLVALALEDPRLVDATVTLLPEGEAATDEYQIPEGAVLELDRVELTGVEPEEQPGVAAATTATVDLLLPLHLVSGVTVEQATAALQSAVDAYLATVVPERPLTADALLAAVRDDTRFGVVRAETIVTVSAGDRFLQLTDGAGSYPPAPGETLRRGALNLDVREGAV